MHNTKNNIYTKCSIQFKNLKKNCLYIEKPRNQDFEGNKLSLYPRLSLLLGPIMKTKGGEAWGLIYSCDHCKPSASGLLRRIWVDIFGSIKYTVKTVQPSTFILGTLPSSNDLL